MPTNLRPDSGSYSASGECCRIRTHPETLIRQRAPELEVQVAGISLHVRMHVALPPPVRRHRRGGPGVFRDPIMMSISERSAWRRHRRERGNSRIRRSVLGGSHRSVNAVPALPGRGTDCPRRRIPLPIPERSGLRLPSTLRFPGATSLSEALI